MEYLTALNPVALQVIKRPTGRVAGCFRRTSAYEVGGVRVLVKPKVRGQNIDGRFMWDCGAPCILAPLMFLPTEQEYRQLHPRHLRYPSFSDGCFL